MKTTLPPQKFSIRTVPGFTLIELVLVLTIIAILAGSGIYLLSGNVDTAKETRVEGDLNALATQLQLYEARCQRLPTTDQGLDALVTKPTKEPVPDRWTALLQETMKDPWGQPYKYRAPSQHSKKSYDIWSAGKDGIDQQGADGSDDIGNWKPSEKK